MNGPTEQRVIGYIRVSTDKQDIGPDVQRAALEAEAERQGWALTIYQENAASAGSLRNRPVLAAALADLKSRKYDALAVSKLDRLSRSVADFAGMLQTAKRQRWNLISLDLGIDTSTLTGTVTAHVLAAVAEMERGRIGERVSDWHKAKHAKGERTGRRSALPDATVARIHAERDAGEPMARIAEALNAEGVPTAAGGRWHASTISQVLSRPAPATTA